jgi:hypothetical protein
LVSVKIWLLVIVLLVVALVVVVAVVWFVGAVTDFGALAVGVDFWTLDRRIFLKTSYRITRQLSRILFIAIQHV